MENGKDWLIMKKIISTLLLISAIFSAVFCGGMSVSAFFGSGAEVIASDVNLIKTGLLGQKISFTDGDFKSALVLSDFDSITYQDPLVHRGNPSRRWQTCW